MFLKRCGTWETVCRSVCARPTNSSAAVAGVAENVCAREPDSPCMGKVGVWGDGALDMLRH